MLPGLDVAARFRARDLLPSSVIRARQPLQLRPGDLRPGTRDPGEFALELLVGELRESLAEDPVAGGDRAGAAVVGRQGVQDPADLLDRLRAAQSVYLGQRRVLG